MSEGGVSFVGPSYQLSTKRADIQRSVNMYVVGMEAPNASPFILHSIPGLTLFARLTGGAIRGITNVEGRCFVAAGNTLYEVYTNGTSIARGTLGSATGTVDFAYGLTQLVLVDGTAGYVLTLATNVFTTISSSAFYGSSRVAFIDNYFVFTRPNTQQFYISAINDATTFNALDFASAEGSPDNLVAAITNHEDLWLFGEYSTEIWVDVGAADFPFAKRGGASLEVGLAAVHSARRIDNSIFWLGQDANGTGMVFRAEGYAPKRISTIAVEQALQASTNIALAVGYCYQENGLTFYALNAPGVAATWVYEVSTGQWHERCDLDTTGQLTQHRATCCAFVFGKRLMGDATGKLYVLDKSVHTNNGDPLVRMRISPHYKSPSLSSVFYGQFALDCTTGEAANGVNPYVELSWLDWNGRAEHWSNALTRSLGQTGQRLPRLVWNRLGESRDRVWKVTFSGNAPFSIINVAIKATQGKS